MEPENKEEIAQTDPALQSPTEHGSEPLKPEKSGKGSKIALVLISILALAGIAFGVYEYMQNSDKVVKISELSAKLDLIKTETKTELVDKDEGGVTQTYVEPVEEVDSEDFIYIGEWGLKFKIPKELHQVSYEVYNNSELNGWWQFSLGVSSLIVTGYKDASDSRTYSKETSESSSCASAWIVRMPKDNTQNTNEPAFSIGDYNFFFGGWQSPCSDTMPTDSQTGPLIRDALLNSSNYSAI